MENHSSLIMTEPKNSLVRQYQKFFSMEDAELEFTPEALGTDIHRAAVTEAKDDHTALTNLFSGRPARGIMNRVMREVGPMSDTPTAFPTAGAALAPLKAAAEANGNTDFTSLWSGQAARRGGEVGAADLTRQLADDALVRLRAIIPTR